MFGHIATRHEKWGLPPSLSAAYTSLRTICLSCLTLLECGFSVVGFSATIPRTWLNALCPSASPQCLSPLTANVEGQYLTLVYKCSPLTWTNDQVPRSSSHLIKMCILSHLLIFVPPLYTPECRVILPHHIVLSHPWIYSINPWFRVINPCRGVLRVGYLLISQKVSLPGMELTFLKYNDHAFLIEYNTLEIFPRC